MKSIYVGNLPFSATEDEIRDLFGEHGEVKEVRMISDRETGRPRGFGFVRMDPAEADAAIEALNGTELGGRTCASMKRKIVSLLVVGVARAAPGND